MEPNQIAALYKNPTASFVENQIRLKGEQKLLAIQHPYSDSEAKTWDTQLTEAEAFTANPLADTPLINNLAVGRGITKADLVGKIMENANLFRMASGAILGQQQKLLDRLSTEAPKTVLTDTINW